MENGALNYGTPESRFNFVETSDLKTKAQTTSAKVLTLAKHLPRGNIYYKREEELCGENFV